MADESPKSSTIPAPSKAPAGTTVVELAKVIVTPDIVAILEKSPDDVAVCLLLHIASQLNEINAKS